MTNADSDDPNRLKQDTRRARVRLAVTLLSDKYQENGATVVDVKFRLALMSGYSRANADQATGGWEIAKDAAATAAGDIVVGKEAEALAT